MLPQLLSIRALLEQAVTSARDTLQTTPNLQETLQALRMQLAALISRLVTAMQLTTCSSIYSAASRWFMKLAKLCIEAIDWLLLPRLAWKITVRHCIALLVLYFVKVFWSRTVIPTLRWIYQFARPFFVNAEYLKQERLLQEKMDSSLVYTDWKKAACELDRLQGRYHWKESSQSLHYDWRRIRDDLKRFRQLVDEQDVRGIMAFSRSRLLRNLVGINDRRLYTHLRAGTKRLIEEYISEVVRALQLVCVPENAAPSSILENDSSADDSSESEAPSVPVSTAEKLSFFNETRHCLLEGTPLATPTGPKLVQHVQKGDQLIGEAGRVLVAAENATLRVVHPSGTLFRVNAVLDDYVVTGDHRITVAVRKLQVDGTPSAQAGSSDYTSVDATLWLVNDAGDLQVVTLYLPVRCSEKKQPRASAAAEESEDEAEPDEDEPAQDESFEQDQQKQYELAVGFGDTSHAASPTPLAPSSSSSFSAPAPAASDVEKFQGTVAQCKQEFERRRDSLVAAVLAQRPGYRPVANFSTVDVQAAAMFRYRKALRLGTVDAKMRTVWTSTPTVSDGSSSSAPVASVPLPSVQALGSPHLLLGSAAAHEAAKVLPLASQVSVGVAVHAESFMLLETKLALETESFSWRECRPGDAPKMTTGFMLHNPLVSTGNVALNAAGHLRQTFSNINKVLQQLQVSPENAGIVSFELNPVPSSTGVMQSHLRKYDAVCASSLRFALKLKLNAIVTFGWFTKYRWMRDCVAGFGDKELRVVSVSAVQPFHGCIDGLTVVLQLGTWNASTDTTVWQQQRVLNVWFAPHPCLGHKLAYVTLAIAAATRVTVDAALVASMRRVAPAFTIEQIEVKKAMNTYNIAVEADSDGARRFALAGGTITHNSFGRSALLLSGGATLGLYHIGVCKSMHDNNLLPRVMSGSSVGSIICAMIGTRTDDQLSEIFDPDSHAIKLNFFPPNGGSTRRKFLRLFSQGVLMDIKILKIQLSGRIINIVVSPASATGNKDSLRLLNYLTAPNVLVWSAALASCAIPGVYAPVELMKKDEKTGMLSPYMEGGAPIKWEDGSVQADLPMQRLSELFNINHFIVSQVNPHVVPLVSSDSSTHTLQQSFLTSPLSKLIDYLSTQLKSTALNFLHLNIIPIHPSVKYVLDQKYLGDITIVPSVTPADYMQLLVNPTSERLRQCKIVSEQSTWKLIPTIRGACEIEFTLDECVRRMRGTLILEEISGAQKATRHRQLSRVRSWSSDLLAVDRQLIPPNTTARDSDDDSESEPVHRGSADLLARTRSGSTTSQPEILRSSSEHDPRQQAQWPIQALAKRVSTSVPATIHLQHYTQEHEPEADDAISEEEAEEEEARHRLQAQLEAQARAADGGDRRGEGECERCVDDEGIMRQVPSRPHLALAASDIGLDSLADSAPPSQATSPRVSPPISTPIVSAVLPVASPHARVSFNDQVGAEIRSRRVNSLSPGEAQSSPHADVTPISAGTRSPSSSITSLATGRLIRQSQRRNSSPGRTAVAASAPSAHSQSASRPRTPELKEDAKLTSSEWKGEKNSARLVQLLKTTQTKVSVSSSPSRPPRRNVRSSLRPPQTVGDVSLHIPSLVSFRHTPPRRMSTMDLALLDSHGSEEAAAPKASSHRHGTMASAAHTDDDSDDGPESPHDQGEAADGGDSGTIITAWFSRASSFFRRDSDSSSTPAAHEGRRYSTPLAGQMSPMSPASSDASANVSCDTSPQPTSFAQRSATHGQLSHLALQPSSPTRTHRALPPHHRTHGHPSSQQLPSSSPFAAASAASRSGSRSSHSSPRHEGARLAHRSHPLHGRLKGTDVNGSTQPILRAATNGLPRTLSQFELISDVTTMP